MNASLPGFAAEATGGCEARKLDSYPLLDWLRFVLASLVALGHEGLPALGPIDAGLAVIVFLALSGWLIGGILLATSLREMPRFFFNRATRIWIPYLAAAALIYGLAMVREGIDLHWFKYLFYDLTFTHYTFTHFPRAGFELPLGGTGNHFWSLSVEEQFYLLAPILMLFLPGGKRIWPWLVVAAGLLAIGSMFTAIALGVVAAIVERDHPGWRARATARWLLPLATIAAFALAWMHDMPQTRALFAVGLILTLAVPGRRGGAGLLLGAISYPFYLNHWLGGFLVHGLVKHLPPLPAAVTIAASYLLAVVVGFVAWAAIDRWVMERRGGWYRPETGRALGVTAYALLAIGLAGGLAIRVAGG